MPPVLRSRTSGARAVSPVVKQENVKQEKKPKPKRKVKQKPETSAPKDKVEKHKGHKVEPPEESADQPMAHGQDVHQPLSSSPTEPLHVALVPDANGKRSGNNEGPPFVFQYNGLTITGGTFEQRATVLNAFLDSKGGFPIQNEAVIRAD